MALTWESEDNLLELIVFYSVHPKDQNEVVRLGRKYLYQLTHLAGPPYLFFET